MSNESLAPSLVKNCHTVKKFEQLYEIYLPRIYAYVSYRVSHPQDVEDLVAEVFYKVLKAINRFEWRGEQAFAVWIFRITRHLISNFYRQQQRWDLPLSVEDLPEQPSATLLPEQVVLLSQTRTNLLTLIKTLSPRQQDVIALKYFGEMGNKEIATVLELEERTVAAYLCRGLKSLQQKCGDSFDLEDWKIWMSICDESSGVKGDRDATSSSVNELWGLEVQIKNLVPQMSEKFKKQLKVSLIEEFSFTANQANFLLSQLQGVMKFWWGKL